MVLPELLTKLHRSTSICFIVILENDSTHNQMVDGQTGKLNPLKNIKQSTRWLHDKRNIQSVPSKERSAQKSCFTIIIRYW